MGENSRTRFALTIEAKMNPASSSINRAPLPPPPSMAQVEEFMDAYNEQLRYAESVRSFEEGSSSKTSFTPLYPPSPQRTSTLSKSFGLSGKYSSSISTAYSSLHEDALYESEGNGNLYSSLLSSAQSFQDFSTPPSPTRSNRMLMSYTNTPISTLKRSRWWQGWLALGLIVLTNLTGFALGHGIAMTILSLPVLLFLNEGFQQTDAEQEATRKCALEGFAKGALLGPPVLALAETVGGVVLALVCFGRTSFESIFNAASEHAMDESLSFSTRLFREASTQNPFGAIAFALFTSLLVAGLSEEAFKMGIGAWQVMRFRAHKKTLNPVVVMAGVGLGLAYAEGIVAISSHTGLTAARLASERVLTSFPVHVFCAVWSAKRAGTSVTWMSALLPAALTHGLFDFGIILCSNFFTRIVGLGWSFTAAAATTVAGIKS